ncbi:hypothetical protein GGR17_000051 [Confluentimicrobium naphthalenivorans]|uniref:Uncharacterized protein n=1 Tax=Actibacterium naphthalenivorans TaxID=1614693 RepID=A0A840C5A6_9RHOB|nr:hypothetical protein [Actibacterium naphthalenivorans]
MGPADAMSRAVFGVFWLGEMLLLLNPPLFLAGRPEVPGFEHYW